MLIVNSPADLGDQKLSPQEANFKIQEENQKLIDAKKIPNQSLLENTDMALGTPMVYSELIRRVQKIAPQVIFEDGGVKNAIAVRHYTYDPYGGDDAQGGYQKKYISGFYKEVLPEFSSITTDKKGLPHRELRGWRSVLLALMKAEVVPFEALVKEFGHPTGQRSCLWSEQTQELRT